MPSGSHGGHSGSHGSHGGGSHHHSSSGGHSSRRPIHFRYRHTRYVVRAGASVFLSFLAMFLFFAIFGFAASWIMKAQSERYLREIEADYIYYQNMIADAKENPDELIVDGTVITKYYNSIADKWYITYFFIADNGESVEGYTFSVYTIEEANNFKRGDIIKLAVDGRPMDSQTDSIPLDYAEMPIQQDGEYATYSSQRRGEKIAMIVCGCAFGGIIVLYIVVMFTNKVKVQDRNSQSQKTQPLEEMSDLANPTDNAEKTINTKKIYCEFCGAEMLPDQKRCPNCRSKRDI